MELIDGQRLASYNTRLIKILESTLEFQIMSLGHVLEFQTKQSSETNSLYNPRPNLSYTIENQALNQGSFIQSHKSSKNDKKKFTNKAL